MHKVMSTRVSWIMATGMALCGAEGAVAGAPTPSSTFEISWSASPTAVPVLGPYGTAALALLVLVVAYRVTSRLPAAARAMVLAVSVGGSAALGLWTEDLRANGFQTPVLEADTCSGTETYTAIPGTKTISGKAPPCFVNNCGSPVTVTYKFISGVDTDRAPLLSAGACTKAYLCFDPDQFDPNDPGSGVVSKSAADGSVIPSDGELYATAFCREIAGKVSTMIDTEQTLAADRERLLG